MQGRFGSLFYVRDEGKDEALLQTVTMDLPCLMLVLVSIETCGRS
jgi:hypothetical protein